MKKRASWNYTDICTTLLLWNCLECQNAETDGNSGSNNIDKHVIAPGYWAKIGKWKCVCWEIPLENFLSMLLHMHSCVQHAVSQMTFTMKRYIEELPWNDQDFIRFSADCQHSELSGAEWCSKAVRECDWALQGGRWEAARELHPQMKEQGALESGYAQGNWSDEIHTVSLASCSFLAPHFGDLWAMSVLGTYLPTFKSSFWERVHRAFRLFNKAIYNVHKNRRYIVRESYESFLTLVSSHTGLKHPLQCCHWSWLHYVVQDYYYYYYFLETQFMHAFACCTHPSFTQHTLLLDSETGLLLVLRYSIWWGQHASCCPESRCLNLHCQAGRQGSLRAALQRDYKPFHLARFAVVLCFLSHRIILHLSSTGCSDYRGLNFFLYK